MTETTAYRPALEKILRLLRNGDEATTPPSPPREVVHGEELVQSRAYQLGQLARERCREEIDALLARAQQLHRGRQQQGLPVFALCGPGRCGKDRSAEMLSQLSGEKLCFGGWSSSKVVLPWIAADLGVSPEQAYQRRHESAAQRVFWYSWCCGLRAREPWLLVELCLARSDLVVGCRSHVELLAGRQRGLVDLWLWLDRPQAPPDPTLEYAAEDCDLVVPNGSSRSALWDRWRSFLRSYGLLAPMWAGDSLSPRPEPAVDPLTSTLSQEKTHDSAS